MSVDELLAAARAGEVITLDGSLVEAARAQVAEEALWSGYVIELARERECWLTYAEAFRVWLRMPQPRNAWTTRQVQSLADLHTESQKRLRVAYASWRAVAFPLNDEPIVNGDGDVIPLPGPRSAG